MRRRAVRKVKVRNPNNNGSCCVRLGLAHTDHASLIVVRPFSNFLQSPLGLVFVSSPLSALLVAAQMKILVFDVENASRFGEQATQLRIPDMQIASPVVSSTLHPPLSSIP